MPIEARIEINGKIFSKQSVNPGATQIPSFFDENLNRVLIPHCEINDEGGSVLIAGATTESNLVDGRYVRTVTAGSVEEKISLGPGGKFTDFIDLSHAMPVYSDRKILQVGQLVIQHRLLTPDN